MLAKSHWRQIDRQRLVAITSEVRNTGDYPDHRIQVASTVSMRCYMASAKADVQRRVEVLVLLALTRVSRGSVAR